VYAISKVARDANDRPREPAVIKHVRTHEEPTGESLVAVAG